MLNGYLKLINTYNEFKTERDKLRNKINDVRQGKRNFIEIITFKEVGDILCESTEKINQIKENINCIAEILGLLSPNIKHVMDEYVNLIKRSFYEMLRTYIADGIALFKKKKEFWNEAKFVKTGEIINQKDILSKD
jgi:predicted nuclease with TOPRIM domain